LILIKKIFTNGNCFELESFSFTFIWTFTPNPLFQFAINVPLSSYGKKGEKGEEKMVKNVR